MRALYFLMAVVLGSDVWSHILMHEGTWNPEAAMAWSVWAAFSLLAIVGLFQPLRMLPIVLLEITYKLIWLVVVAYPLWAEGTLAGRTEEMTFSFLWVVIAIVATPWGYVFRAFLRRERGTAGIAGMESEPELSYEGVSS